MGARQREHDPISPWFVAAEDLGEYIGVRFGRINPDGSEPEWIFLRHADYDGIGGFAHILRNKGAAIDALPEQPHPARPSRFDVLRLAPIYLQSRRQPRWNSRVIQPQTKGASRHQVPTAVAWHVFSEIETNQIIAASKRHGVSVNSLLVNTLTRGIRPFLEDSSATVPWMIPVNLRGKVRRDRDTANFTSCVGVKVKAGEIPSETHRNIFAALDRKVHWANWQAYDLGKFTSHGMRKFLIATGLAISQLSLGSFSNLGVWDAAKSISVDACRGNWLFSPPVLRCQPIGAGCVTFQNQLSLTIQAHPELTTQASVCQAWIQSWVQQIKLESSPGSIGLNRRSETSQPVKI